MAGELEHTGNDMVLVAEEDHVDVLVAWLVEVIAVSVDTVYCAFYHIRGYLQKATVKTFVHSVEELFHHDFAVNGLAVVSVLALVLKTDVRA